jgi:hypothetical protein
MILNRIDWENAPEWANWLAQDHDGGWWWFENKPSLGTHCWNRTTGKYARIDCAQKLERFIN